MVRASRALVLAVAVIALAVLLAYGFIHFAAWRVERAAFAEETPGPLWTHEQIVERFPDGEANDAALRLERLAARLGFDLVPKSASRSPGVVPTNLPWDALRADAVEALFALIATSDRDLHRLPPPVLDHLAAEEAKTDALVSLLVAGAPPRWEQKTGEGHLAPIPNLLGHVRLSRFLASDALRRLEEGRLVEAERLIEAGMQLAASLRERPEVISQLIAAALTRDNLGLLRHHLSPSPAWIERLESLDLVTPHLDALRVDAWSALKVWKGPPSHRPGTPLGERVRFRALQPIGRMTSGDYRAGLEAYLAELEQGSLPCTMGAGAPSVELAWWNDEKLMPKDLLFGTWTASSVMRIARVERERELTLAILRARAALARGDQLSPTWRPYVCLGETWQREVGEEGVVMRSDADDSLFASLKGASTPREFRIAPTRSAGSAF